LEPGPVVPGNQRFDGGLAAGTVIAGTKPRPTAVIAMNDLTAVGVIKALYQLAIRVPEDISVVGFDRIPLSECYIPSLTTVDMHPNLLGQTTADALLELCTTEKRSGREYWMPLHLVEGHSTGPVSAEVSEARLTPT
jgi:DNA-binding LacI/PurR family transcriptional regulator